MTSERLAKYLSSKNISVYSLENTIGASRGAIAKAINDKKSIGSNFVENILIHYPDLNPEWLLIGKGSMIRSDSGTPLVTAIKTPVNGIPLVSIHAVGGFGGVDFAIQEADVQDRYIIPKFKDKKVDFMIEVAGSSMQPKYNSGDVVACTVIRESQFVQWGRVHVIGTIEQGLLVKRLFETGGNYIECRSDNENYPPFKIPLPEITGIALVVGVIRLE